MHLRRGDVPDPIWPHEPTWGVPLLDLALQAGLVDRPLVRWGRARVRKRLRGTVHFYTADYRFRRLWQEPQQVVNSGVVAAVEPNYSADAQTPLAVVLWNTYRKRWLARLWQAHGVRIFVDIHVVPEHAELNLLGVPAGWASYATRGSVDDLELLERRHELAVARAGGPVTLLVYGGGRAVRDLCAARAWPWAPEESDAVRAAKLAKLQPAAASSPGR